MHYESFIMWYLIFGIIITVINGAVRKIEADALLGFAWILIWPFTVIILLIDTIRYIIKKV